MNIIADENIPYVDTFFGNCGNLVLKPGRSIQRIDLLQADILLVRSVTTVNEKLLHDTPVKFVGSATTGSDHLDLDWLNKAGIAWSVSEGCNTQAVVEYVIAVIAALEKMAILPFKKPRVGVIGLGKIGSRVADVCKRLGFDVVQCDPLRALAEPNFASTPLDAFTDLDLITLHTPLTRTGPYPTYHLIDKSFLERQEKNCVLLNSSRGAVIDFSDLLEYGRHLYWCLDVWEHEPMIDIDALQTAIIATPHIAGYSVESKIRGIEMLYQAACQQHIIMPRNLPTVELMQQSLSTQYASDWRDGVLAVYDPRVTTKHMQTALLENDSAQTFDALRKSFAPRHEFSSSLLQQFM